MTTNRSEEKLRLEQPGAIHSWGKYGTEDGQFRTPRGIAIAMDGTIIVADSRNDRIQCFRSDGTFLLKWGRLGEEDGEFKSPYGVAIGLHDGLNSFVLSAVMQVPILDRFPPGVVPICVAYVGNETVYVVERVNHRVQVFGMDGAFRLKWGVEGAADGEFSAPSSCLVYRDSIYVADMWNNRIQVFRPDGTFIRKWDSRDKGPFGISITPTTGMLYVLDNATNTVSCYYHDGTPCGVNNLKATTDGFLGSVAADDEYLYITYTNACECGIRTFRIRTHDKGVGCAADPADADLPHVADVRLAAQCSPIAIARSPNDRMLYIVDSPNSRIVAIQV